MVRVTLKTSRQIAAALIGVHLGAAATLFPLDLPFWAKLAIGMLVAASLVTTVRRHALLRSRAAVVAVELHEHDRAALQARDGLWHEARILGTTYVSPLLTVLNLRVHDRWIPRHVLVVTDNVDAEDYRRLRVWLRWGYRQEPRSELEARATASRP